MNKKQLIGLKNIAFLLLDGNINNIDLEGDDEQFGALMTIGHLRNKIYPILDRIREVEREELE